jgi:hypothetical protein
MSRLLLSDGERQGKGGPLPRPGTLGVQRTAKVFGCQRAAVQTEPVPFFARGEAVTEDPLEIFWRNADASIDDLY